jgi:hypothetical protein
MASKHKILLVNFTPKEVSVVAKAGYNVDGGFIGKAEVQRCQFYTPHPIYEYDILFYNTVVTPELDGEFTKTYNLLTDGSFETLKTFSSPPHVRISFVGDTYAAKSLVFGGLLFLEIERAELNVSSFLEMQQGAFAIKDLHRLLTGFKNQIAKVVKFISAPSAESIYPFHHNVVLATRSGKTVVAYGTTYGQGTLPRYIVLPQLQDNVHGVIEILKCLEDVWPSLFPDKVKKEWLQGDEFLLPEEIRLRDDVERIIKEATTAIETKKQERERLANEHSFVRGLLVATENSELKPAKRLSGVVKRALEFLEFRVEDIDAQIKSAIRKEDFWVIDGNFLGITEVTGTVNKNPKIKEFNDILGRLATIYKRKSDLPLPAGANVSGLLVLNYDIENHPAKRPKAYTGDEQHIVDSAIEQGIGILSTVELHKLVMAVMRGHLSKNQARLLIKKPGRIEYDSGTGRSA